MKFDNLVFLDTETTGNGLSDRLFEVCFAHRDKIVCEYFKPPVPISIDSQSITHVTNKMVEEKQAFADSEMKKELQALLKDNILVAHNAVFDVAMLSKEGVEVPRFICSMKVARYLDEEGKIPKHSLQYLRYLLELEVEADAHDAKGDVIVLRALFERLFEGMVERCGSEEAAIEKMIEVSLQPVLLHVFTFGKYKGRRVVEIVKTDRGYIEWLLGEKKQKPEDEEDWIFSLEFHLKTS